MSDNTLKERDSSKPSLKNGEKNIIPGASRMRYYPIFADLSGRPVVVIGGGVVAERKVKSLLLAGAEITIVSPRLTKALQALADGGRVRALKRKYRNGDLMGASLAVSASDRKDVNTAVRKEADSRSILLNVVDDPVLCDFIVPSVIDRGDLVVAISTSGQFPALAKKLRKDIEKTIGTEYEQFTLILGAARKILLKRGESHVKKESVIKALLDSQIPEMIKAGCFDDIDALLKRLLGKDCGLTRLDPGHKLRLKPQKSAEIRPGRSSKG